MAEKASKKTTNKKPVDDSEEVVTEDIKITEKVSSKGTASNAASAKGTKVSKETEEVEETKASKDKAESEELSAESKDEETDSNAAEVEGGEKDASSVEAEGEVSEDVDLKKETENGDYENEEKETATVESSDEESEGSSDAKRATVYADDFDAVRVEKRFSMNRLLLFILIIVISAAIFFTGMMLYQSNNGNFSLPQLSFLSQPTPTPTEAPEPTPSPTPEIDNSDYSVQVLNGSGVSGAAGAVAGLLEEEGFENVEVGNADAQDFTDTEVQLQEDVPSEVFDEIADILSDYTVVEGDELDEEDEFDIIITVGQENEAEEDEDEPTPTEAEKEE
jgi:hypothetical protein